MITLHLIQDDKASEQLREKLDELVISYQTEEHPPKTKAAPWIEEDGKEYKTKEEIEQWVQQLEGELSWQHSLSGDGCYIDPEKGTVC